MRTIRFRAWDEKTKQMKCCGVYPDGVPMAYAGGENAVALYDRPLMQFTGLFDKNGKEIYEGDVVRLIETPPLLGESADFIALDYIGVVEWDDEGCDYNITGKDELRGLGNGKQIIEVIGNIYENPELIKPL